MSKDLVIRVDYGGLGDHLFFSHIPRIAKSVEAHAGGGGYNRVYIHSSSPFRHNDYKRIVWELNPYVDGFIDSEATPRKEFGETFTLTQNLLDNLMLSYGLDDGVRLHEPEIYYQPKFRQEYHKVIFDPNYVTNSGDCLDFADVMEYFDKNNIHIDAVMADMGGKRCFDSKIDIEQIRTKSLEDFCDLLYSARAIYCFATGTATLAAALKVSVNVLYKQNVSPIFMHSPLHKYIILHSNRHLFKVWKQRRIFGKKVQLGLKVGYIDAIASFIPLKSLKKKFKGMFRARNAHRLKAFVPSTSTQEVENILSIAQEACGEIRHIFEFGSRYGEDSCEFAKNIEARGIKAHIWSFECNENTIEQCRSAVGAYSSITLTESAVSDSDGFISFYKINPQQTGTTHADGNQGASSTLKASGKYPMEQYVQDEVKVPCLRLDSFMARHNISHIDVLWMDIQGGELSALKGLGERIKDVKLIYSEIEFMEIYENQPLFEDIKHYLDERGFVFLGFVGKNKFFANGLFVRKELYTPALKALLESDKIKGWLTE